MGVQIKEIRIIENQPQFNNPFTNKSAFDRALFESTLPYGLVSFIYRTKRFYTLPVNTEDNYRIEVMSVFLKSDNEEFNYANPKIHLDLDDITYYLGNTSTTTSQSSNLMYFTNYTESQYFENGIDYVKVQWKWGEEEEKISFLEPSSSFERKVYNFFTWPPGATYGYRKFQPNAVTGNVFWAVWREDRVDDAKLLDIELLERLQWVERYSQSLSYSEVTNYIDSYMGYEDVFMVKKMFREGLERDDLLATQNFYVVEDEETWKIIDISLIDFH